VRALDHDALVLAIAIGGAAWTSSTDVPRLGKQLLQAGELYRLGKVRGKPD
jgi:hypothetical protein